MAAPEVDSAKTDNASVITDAATAPRTTQPPGDARGRAAGAIRARVVDSATTDADPSSQTSPPTAFADDAAYLQHQLERVRALLEGAIALSLADPAGHALAVERERRAADAIAARLSLSRERGFVPALEQLRARLSLDSFEHDVLLHVLAPSLDPAILKLHARLSGVAYRNVVDVGFVLHVHFAGVAERLRARARFQPGGRLVDERLVLLDRSRPDAREGLLACELKLPPPVVRALLGEPVHEGGAPYSALVEPDLSLDDVVLPDEARAELSALVDAQPRLAARLVAWGFARASEAAAPPGQRVVLLLTGPPGTGKSMLARAFAKALDKRLLVVDVARLSEAIRAPSRSPEQPVNDALDDLFVEARRADAVVLFDECEPLFASRGSGNRGLGAMLRALDRFSGVAILATDRPDEIDVAVDRRVLLRLSLDVPPPPLRERIWRLHLPREVPLAPDVDLSQLAKRYDFAGGYIKSAVSLAVRRAIARESQERPSSSPPPTSPPSPSPPRLSMDDLERAAQAQLRGDLSGFAERTRSALSLDALVLPPDVRSQIEEIIAAGRNRAQVLYGWGLHETIPTGKGQVVLLSGDPGTGKTLSAEVIAAELGMNLYRINPAKVVSKFVGETEKNLHEVLAQAKSMHAILFFDEADALFASRVAKVESANDRFVNMETNFLLQQLERFEGLVILATNLETSIDQAFKRRIHYHVVVPFPDAPARERIWRTILPARAPVAPGVDFARLGKTFELSGGHIKNAVMRAAFMAAQAKSPITQALLFDAAEKECAAAGKLFRNPG